MRSQRHVHDLSPTVVARLVRLEEQLLRCHVWKSSSLELWEYLDQPGVRAALLEWLSKGSDDAQVLASPIVIGKRSAPRESPGRVIVLGPATPIKVSCDATFQSPVCAYMRICQGGNDMLSNGVKLFFKKTLALCSVRAAAICEALGMHDVLLAQVERAIRYCLVQTRLGCDRCVDTLLMCCIVAVGRLYAKSLGESDAAPPPRLQEITFNEVIGHYRNLTASDTSAWQTAFRGVLLANGQHSHIIDFYNQFFVPEMDEFIRKFQMEYAHAHVLLLTVRFALLPMRAS